MAGNKINNPNALTDGLVWALLTYQDGSQFCFQTTLNGALLAKYGVILEEGKLVRLDKKYLVKGDMVYKQFKYEGTKISLWDAETYTDAVSAGLRQFL